jgi:hypothetical protein
MPEEQIPLWHWESTLQNAWYPPLPTAAPQAITLREVPGRVFFTQYCEPEQVASPQQVSKHLLASHNPDRHSE